MLFRSIALVTTQFIVTTLSDGQKNLVLYVKFMHYKYPKFDGWIKKYIFFNTLTEDEAQAFYTVIFLISLVVYVSLKFRSWQHIGEANGVKAAAEEVIN